MNGKWIFVLAFVAVFLQGCRQAEGQQVGNTAVPTPMIRPTTNNSAEISVLGAISTPTPLPIPAAMIPTATATILPPAVTPTPQDTGQLIIGYSVQDRPITAFRAGTGERKVVIIGGGELAQLWIAQYQNNPGAIPSGLAIWFVPNPNPDSTNPENPLNANGVNLYQNADSRYANCSGQSSQPETNGPYPFSEAESRALRAFLADSWLALFVTADTPTSQPGGCGPFAPSSALASLLSASTAAAIDSTPLPQGHFINYLAGQGTAAAVISPDVVNTAVLDTLLANTDQIAAAEGGRLQWVGAANSGQWQFPAGTFVHPLALEIVGQSIYILDSGQVQRLDQQTAAMPGVILAPDDVVAGVRVIEPLDLAADGSMLLVLDRAGDVYGYDPQTESWSVRRYDRPVGQTSSHYYLALAAQVGTADQHYLLEGSYHFALNQRPDAPDFIWPLPEDHQIDITVDQGDVYVLSQSPISQTASLVHYQDGARDHDFFPQAALHRARQVQAVGSLVYVLDYDGRRLAAVDAETGALDTTYLPANGTPWSAFLVDEANGRILLAGQDSISFFGMPGNAAVIQGTGSHQPPQMNDPLALEMLRGLLMPIGGSDIAVRENQMPGAPRHYRLGIHEGADFYWQSGTPVRAVAAGTVIRATVDYQLPTPEMFAGWSAAVYALGYTSAEAHDFYRGRQVWIQHEGGLISRYVHLSIIDTMIREGVTVEAGQIVGAVGNTGSPVSLEGPNVDAHLHFELWLNDHYLGQYLRPIETREWLAIILNEQ